MRSEFLCPADRRYSEEHEWAQTRADGTIAVGVTDYAQAQLGLIEWFTLPAVGDFVESGMPFAEVETIKSVSDIYSPCTGVVVEVNERLRKDPTLANHDPYNQGWVVYVRPSTPTALDLLMDADGYEAFVAHEIRGRE